MVVNHTHKGEDELLGSEYLELEAVSNEVVMVLH